MNRTLPSGFLTRPIAHRGLHDASKGRPENSLPAVQAAVQAGYGIEIDLQLTSDEKPVVFHDYDLSRLTEASGAVNLRRAADLRTIPLKGATNEGIPQLDAVLEIIKGQVPVLIEIKDQDGALGPEIGPLEAAVAQAINTYSGLVAVMSFNPHSVAAMQTLAPSIPRGLVTENFLAEDWRVTEKQAASLTLIEDFERVGACFISHDKQDLDRPRVADLKSQGARILTWTIKSEKEERKAREIAENITFEGYLPSL